MFGGAEGNRTPDLDVANVALSQLSYGPLRWIVVHRVFSKAFWTGFSFLVYDLYKGIKRA